MIDKELLEILCCPETKEDVYIAKNDLIDKLNSLIDKKELKNRNGDIIEGKIDSGLIRQDMKFIYPIREDIPIMLIDEAIPLEKIIDMQKKIDEYITVI